MGYCDGLCPHLDSEKHKCQKTGKKLGYIKGWWGTTHEHHGFEDCDDEGLKDVQDRLYGALWKLMEYEDIGLSPDDVKYAEYALEDAAEEIEEYSGMETNLVGEIKDLLAKFN